MYLGLVSNNARRHLRDINTFGRIRSLVITLAKPFQVLIFNPRHPLFVLLLVGLSDPFGIGFLLSLLGGQVVVEVLLLFFCVLASGARCLVYGVHFVELHKKFLI